MATENRFQIVFDKLTEVLSEPTVGDQADARDGKLGKASEEIDDLRRAILEINEPPVSLFTTT